MLFITIIDQRMSHKHQQGRIFSGIVSDHYKMNQVAYACIQIDV
jgi:hypothetical protein